MADVKEIKTVNKAVRIIYWFMQSLYVEMNNLNEFLPIY